MTDPRNPREIPEGLENLTKEDLVRILKGLSNRAKEEKPDPTVGEIIDKYMAHIEWRVGEGDFSRDHADNHEYVLRLFKAVHGEKHVFACKQADLTGFIRANQTWKSGYTQQSASSAVCCCFQFAKNEGLIEANPFRRVKIVGQKQPRRPCEPHEYCTLMRNATRALRRLLFFLRRTGCRTCEARELTWEDVRLDLEIPVVVLNSHKTVKRTRKARTFGLDAGTARFLRNLRRQAPEGNVHVFLNCSGHMWTRRALASALRRLCARLNLDADTRRRLSAYGLRHMFAVQAIEAGLSSRQIADQLGHESTQMIDRIYGSHTRTRAAHLGRVVTESTRRRLRERPRSVHRVCNDEE